MIIQQWLSILWAIRGPYWWPLESQKEGNVCLGSQPPHQVPTIASGLLWVALVQACFIDPQSMAQPCLWLPFPWLWSTAVGANRPLGVCRGIPMHKNAQPSCRCAVLPLRLNYTHCFCAHSSAEKQNAMRFGAARFWGEKVIHGFFVY